MDNPTNKDLQESIRKGEETFRVHAVEDVKQFEQIHREFDQVHTRFDNLPTVIEIETAVKDAVIKTVNGKIDKVNTTLAWMQKIAVFGLPIAIGLFAWSIQWEITIGNQVAGMAATVKYLAAPPTK